MSSKPPSIAAAQTLAEILEAVARGVWAKDHDGAECPPEQIPTEAELSDFADGLPDGSLYLTGLAAVHGDRWGRVSLADYRRLQEGGIRRWLEERDEKRVEELATAEWWVTDEGIESRRLQGGGMLRAWTRADAEGDLEATRQRLAAEAESDREMAWEWLTERLSTWEPGRLYSLASTMSGPWRPPAETLLQVHTLWRALRDFEEQRGGQHKTLHPLAALVRGWQTRPVLGQAEHRSTGIQPALLGWVRGGLVPAGDGDASHLPEALGPKGARVAQGHLFANLEPGIVACPWISLVDATGTPIGTQGRGAPLVYRLFVEAQMSVGLGGRSPGRWLAVPGRTGGPITLREVTEWLYPNGFRRRDLPAVRRAMAQLHNLRIEHDGWEWGLAMFGKLPTAQAQLDDELELLVRYLPGSERGPLVDREALRLQGLTSAPRWRLYLRLAYLWDEAKARNGGHRIYAARPVVNRDREGFVLDQTGKRILERGAPTRNTFHPRAVRIYDGDRLLTEANPRTDRLLELGADDLARLAFDEHLTSGNRRRRTHLARKALRELEAAGLVRVLEGSNGGVRIAEVYRESGGAA